MVTVFIRDYKWMKLNISVTCYEGTGNTVRASGGSSIRELTYIEFLVNLLITKVLLKSPWIGNDADLDCV